MATSTPATSNTNNNNNNGKNNTYSWSLSRQLSLHPVSVAILAHPHPAEKSKTFSHVPYLSHFRQSQASSPVILPDNHGHFHLLPVTLQAIMDELIKSDIL